MIAIACHVKTRILEAHVSSVSVQCLLDVWESTTVAFLHSMNSEKTTRGTIVLPSYLANIIAVKSVKQFNLGSTSPQLLIGINSFFKYSKYLITTFKKSFYHRHIF